jgi:hypothetical protein|tara:strand:- start:346 stop:567 length:222 start_codon:yes stop_codon:yes gene_type:complete
MYRLAQPFDIAIMGECSRAEEHFLIYDRDKVLAILEHDDMSREDAEMTLETIQAAYAGRNTPGFISSRPTNLH